MQLQLTILYSRFSILPIVQTGYEARPASHAVCARHKVKLTARTM